MPSTLRASTCRGMVMSRNSSMERYTESGHIILRFDKVVDMFNHVNRSIESMIKYCLSKLMSEFIITYNVSNFFLQKTVVFC